MGESNKDIEAEYYPKKSRTSTTEFAKSSTEGTGVSEEIPAAPNCKNS